jgi:class 3 adenylate cyclase
MPTSDEVFGTYVSVGPEAERTVQPLSGTVTFLFTDIEGSTRLWEQHPEAMSEALTRHDAILVDAVESGGGHVVKTTGDGLFAVFGRAEPALAAALAAQRSLVGAAWDSACELRVRMGLHTGDAEFRGRTCGQYIAEHQNGSRPTPR